MEESTEFGKMNCPVDGKAVRESTELGKMDALEKSKSDKGQRNT